MKTATFCHLKAWILLLAFGLSLGACSEKKADTPAATPKKPANDDGSTDDTDDVEGDSGSDDGETDSGTSSNYDFCTEAKSKMSAASSFFTELCDNLSSLRGKYFKGGTPNAEVQDKGEANQQSKLHVRSSILVNTKPEEYFAMLRLQYKDPDKFSQNFTVEPHVKLRAPLGSKQETEIDSTKPKYTESSAEFSYFNNKDTQFIIFYDGKTSFIKLKDKQAYATISNLDASNGELVSLKGMVVINLKDGKTEVFSIADQTYNSLDNHAKVVQDVTTELKAEQTRSYKNGSDADKAVDLLGGD